MLETLHGCHIFTMDSQEMTLSFDLIYTLSRVGYHHVSTVTNQNLVGNTADNFKQRSMHSVTRLRPSSIE